MIISIQTGTNLLGAESNHGTPLIKMGNIQRGFFSFKKVEFLNENEQVEEKNMINFGDFLFNTRNTLDLVGKGATWFGKNDEYAFNSNIARFTFEGINTIFFNYLYNTPQMIKQVQARAVGTTSVAAVYPKDLNSIKFWIPSANEQQKIGALFKQIDDTITLHQRMSDKQKKLKANLLQMMFPRNGEKIPEVRLAGFAEDWSQRTLEDISDKVTEKNKAREFTETLTNSAEYGIISQSDYFDKDISNINNIDGYYVVRPDDFVYNPRISNFAPVGPIKRNNLNRIGIMSPLYYVFRPKRVDHTFLEKYFETSYWHIFMKMNGDSGARADRFAIKDTILKEMPIPYPIKEEQVKIGIFFNQLDKSIVLHQEKIAHLKVLKSTLLNKMFI